MADKETSGLTEATEIGASDEIHAVVGGNSRRVKGAYAGIAKGTSFPGSPATGMRFYRTDRNIEYFYDGTRWLSTTLHELYFTQDSNAINPITQTVYLRAAQPYTGDYGIYLEDFVVVAIQTAGATASNYYTFQVSHSTGASTTNVGSTASTQGDTLGSRSTKTIALNAALASSVQTIELGATETGVATIYLHPVIRYRLIG